MTRKPAFQLQPQRQTKRRQPKPAKNAQRKARPEPAAKQEDAQTPPPPGGSTAPPPSATLPPVDLTLNPAQALQNLAEIGAANPADLPPLDPRSLELPSDLNARISQRQRRIAALMLNGLSYQKALDALGLSPRHALRNTAPHPNIAQAVDHWNLLAVNRAATSRQWILAQTVAIFRRAAQAEPVLDRRGNPTGEYNFAGPTAVKCLELLGLEAGMFGKRITHDVDKGVKALMAAVAGRGKPQLAPPAPRTAREPVTLDAPAGADRGSAPLPEKP